MTTRGNPPDYPRNPAYGHGTFRRRIRLAGHGDHVQAALEDTNHGFCVTIHHDGQVVTAITPEAKRTPYDTCPEAGRNLQALVGQRIGSSARDLNLAAGPGSNCTHWLDLAVLAVRHATRGPLTWQWDVTVTDERDDADSIVSVYRNGEPVYQWKARSFFITEPAELAGKPLYMGFGKWASSHFSDEAALEAAFIMQKGYFVAQARRFDIDQVAGEPAIASEGSMGGVCYTYSPGAIERGVRLANSTRDFSEDDTQLLQFR